MKRLLAALCALTLVITVVRAADEKLAGKCPVSGKDIVKDASVDYKGAKVYFCCPGCPDAFKADTAKFAAKANQQLVQTKQATQEKCPLSGGKLNPDTAVKVGEVSVTFCCNMCKGKVEKAEGDAQRDLVFSDTAFEKGFKVAKAK